MSDEYIENQPEEDHEKDPVTEENAYEEEPEEEYPRDEGITKEVFREQTKTLKKMKLFWVFIALAAYFVVISVLQTLRIIPTWGTLAFAIPVVIVLYILYRIVKKE